MDLKNQRINKKIILGNNKINKIEELISLIKSWNWKKNTQSRYCFSKAISTINKGVMFSKNIRLKYLKRLKNLLIAKCKLGF